MSEGLYKYGLTKTQWNAAKQEIHQILSERARLRGMIAYSELAAQLQSVQLEANSFALFALLGEISWEEDKAGRGMFSVIKEKQKMNIVMGDDEFILYIRKQYPNCKTGNDDLGKAIWGKLKSLGAEIKKPDVPCYWGNSGPFVAVNKLPKTAAQFSFDRACLPQLYDFLDQLGQQE